jgi:F-type H+-transporting ATPase subunit b
MVYYLSLLYKYSILLLLSGDGHENPSLLSVNPGLIIWTIIIFFILLFVLKKIAWKPLLKALNSREESIRSAMENAEKLNKEAEQMIEQNKKDLSEANAKSIALINEAKDMANKVREEIIHKANEDSRKTIDRAKEEIEQQKETALNEMKDEISDIAIKAAEKIISENLDDKKQKKIIDDFLIKIPKN